MGQPSFINSERRLDSWKEIAAFFARDERTVRRWEKESALPVRRVPGGAKGRVFAYESELRQWLTTPQAFDGSVRASKPEIVIATDANARPDFATAVMWAAALATCVALVAGILIYREQHRFAVNAAAAPASYNHANQAALEAEEFYLKGRYYWNKRTPDDLNRAVDYFTQAIVHDPSYAMAYVGLADCYNLLREYSAMAPSEAYPRALAAARKAVELDDSSAEAHNSLAFVTFYWNWDVAGAEREFKRAIALNPSLVQAHHWYATFLLSCGRYQEALSQIELARKLNPSSAAILADKGQILRASGRINDSEILLKQVASSDPSFVSAHRYLLELYFDRGDYPSYLAEWRQMALLTHDKQDQAIEQAAEAGYSRRSTKGMLEGMLAEQEKIGVQGSVTAYSIARTCVLTGRKQEGLQYLKAAVDQRDTAALFLAGDRFFSGLRDDPGYQSLIERIRAIRPN